MIELNEEQRRALTKGALPILVDPETKQEYVLVKAEIYSKVRAIVDGITKRAAWDDPSLDVYESYRKSE